MSVVWHDLECGGYTADLPVWRGLAARYGGPVLDVGAGAGRTTLDLARAGYQVTALDLDPDLLDTLRRRADADGLTVTTAVGDARTFHLGARFALCIVPMQTIQLLGGATGRARFLDRAVRHLSPGGAIAVALTDELELFEVTSGSLGPLPDVCEVDGVVYSSRPLAVRADGDGYVLVRCRETVTTDGSLDAETNLIHLDRLNASTLEHEAAVCGLQTIERIVIDPTDDHVGSTVVVLGA